MDIGKEKEKITVEPLKDPVPRRGPQREPARKDPPDPQPEQVPTRSGAEENDRAARP